jgi:hypothetical protein
MLAMNPANGLIHGFVTVFLIVCGVSVIYRLGRAFVLASWYSLRASSRSFKQAGNSRSPLRLPFSGKHSGPGT